MSKFLKYLLALLMIVSAIIVVVFFAMGESAQAETTVPLMLNWAIILLVVAIALAVILPMFFSSGKGGKKTLISLGIMVVLCAISYVCASDAIPERLTVPTDPTTMKLTDAGLILTCALTVFAVLAIIGGALINAFKK